MKNNFLRLFFGIILGGAMMLGLIAVAFISFKVGNRAVDYLDIENKKPEVDYSFLKHNFKIGFETEEESKIFDATTAAYVISDEFAAEGKHSAKAEFPSGREFPGISLDVYGKDCFDWSAMEEFSFVVFNSIDLSANLKIKIRSGAQYPKETYETNQTIPPMSVARIKISRHELEGSLDLGHISGISVFMQDPPTTFILYFDDMKVTKKP